MTPEQFWRPWETKVSSLLEFHGNVEKVHTKWNSGKSARHFAWRGVSDSSFPLHSSLYRELANAGSPPNEVGLSAAEDLILREFRDWGLHQAGSGRLGALERLAILQHYQAPTRLIDVTFSPLIALWFAVRSHVPDSEGKDGRVFAVDVTDRLINTKPDAEEWEAALKKPWLGQEKKLKWSTSVYAWRPPPFERRIAAQQAGFLVGGVPGSSESTSGNPKQWEKAPGKPYWKIAEVRQAMSVAVRFHQLAPRAGGVRAAGQPSYTFRVAKTAKDSIRRQLEATYGYSERTLFPDYAGVASYVADHKKWT